MSKFPARTVNSYGNCQHIRLSNVSIFSPLEDSHLAFGFAGCSPEWGSAALLGSPFHSSLGFDCAPPVSCMLSSFLLG